MSETRPENVSVIEPLGPAVERVKDLLFRPFDMGRWFAIGVCAWLATLGEGGGPGGIRLPGREMRGFENNIPRMHEVITPYIGLIIIGVVVLVVIGIAIGIVLLWLRCRGQFMFINCIARNSDEVKAPWHEFRKEANSLFWFLLVFGIISAVVLIVIGGLIALATIAIGTAGRMEILAVVVAILLATVFLLPAVLIIGVALAFIGDFVVPIMYIRRTGWREAWGEFWQLLCSNKGRFALYILFQIALVVCLTCCTAACLLAIPYIGTVAMLPVLAFSKSYSLCYLAQYGPRFDVFAGQQTGAEQLPQIIS
jgi:hypothetical protein